MKSPWNHHEIPDFCWWTPKCSPFVILSEAIPKHPKLPGLPGPQEFDKEFDKCLGGYTSDIDKRHKAVERRSGHEINTAKKVTNQGLHI